MSAETDRIRLTIRWVAGTLAHMNQSEREKLAESLFASGHLSSRGYRVVMRHRHWYWRAWYWCTLRDYSTARRLLTTED